jgi:hypothetical protein
MNAKLNAYGDKTISIRDVDYTVNPAVTILEITLNEKIELRKL